MRKLSLAGLFSNFPTHHTGYLPDGRQRLEVNEAAIENEIQQIDRLLAAGYDFDTPKVLNGSLQSKILFVC